MNMEKVNIHQAKTNLSRLLERVALGEEVIISKAGKPVAKLVPFTERSIVRKPGLLKGKIKLEANFDDPLPDELLQFFERS